MTLKKLFLLIVTAFSFSQLSYSAEAAAPQPDHISAEESQEIILICQQIQKECSQQIDFLTAIIQQIIGGIQQGTVKTTLNKELLLKRIHSYISLTHELQGMSVMTAREDNLCIVTIILKNLIDRLTLAIDSNLTLLDDPQFENLVTPEKNFVPSFEYLLMALEKNNRKLNDLAHSSTSLGLTQLNKTVRALESFYQNYKWFIWAPVGLAGLYLLKKTLNTPFNYTEPSLLPKIIDGELVTEKVSKTVTTTYGEHFKSSLKESFSLSTFMGMAGTIGYLSAKDKIAQIGTAILGKVSDWTSRNYLIFRKKLTDSYNHLKGVHNISKEGIATSLDSVPTLDDDSLIGLEDQKRELNKIIDYLRDPELYIRSDNEIGKCILLTGPSRTGKTALAKSFGATINKLFTDMGSRLKAKFIEIDYSFITRTADLKIYIEHALENAPCILFIDEIHLLSLQKTGNKELLNEFLTQLTELHKIKDPLKQVFIIAATNHPELLAPELFKHERFGKVIRFKKPGMAERTYFFESTFKKYGINAENITIKNLVLQTKDCDYGHLQQIIKDARFEARAHGQSVQEKHLTSAINTIVHGINSTAELSAEEARIAAIDQAGKIVAHYKLGVNETIHLATIGKIDGKIEEENYWIADKKDTEVMPTRYGALISSSGYEEIAHSNSLELEKLCKRSLSGIAAQKILLDTYYLDYSAQDYKIAFEIAQKIILKGLQLKMLPEEQRSHIFQATQKLIDSYEQEVTELLKAHLPLINTFVTFLIKDRCITGKDIDTVVQ